MYNNAARQVGVNRLAEKVGASSGTARYYGVPGTGNYILGNRYGYGYDDSYGYNDRSYGYGRNDGYGYNDRSYGYGRYDGYGYNDRSYGYSKDGSYGRGDRYGYSGDYSNFYGGY